MAKLVFLNKNFEEQQYEFVLEKTTVGRGNHNTLVICDKSVSATHCEILVNGPEVIVRDLASSNGTFVDGARLNNQGQAKNGNIIKFGLVEARLELPAPKDEDGDEAKLTAVMDLRELQANRRREERQKKIHPEVEGKVEPSANAGITDISGKTVLVPRPPGQRPRPAAAQTAVPPEKRSSNVLIVIVAGVVVLALSTFVWWMWLKK